MVIQNLEPGYYTVVEAQAPYGYLIDPEHSVQTIEIKPDAVGKNLTIIFRNPPKPKILIEKIDGDTGAYLPGAVFHVAKKDSIEYVEVTTGSAGTVLLENLDAEWYTITEVRAPNGYVLDSTPKNIQAVSGKTVTVSYNNFGNCLPLPAILGGMDTMRKFLARICPNLGRYYFALMILLLMFCFCGVTVFAVEDMWTVANRIIVDVYTKIAGISTVLAGLMSAVAVIGAKLSNNQHKTDQAWDWLKRIWIAWVVINGIGAFLAYIVPLFQGLATLTP